MRDRPSDVTVHRPTTLWVSVPSQDVGPRTLRAFEEVRRAIFTEGALDAKTKQLIAVCVAHVAKCPSCFDGHRALAERAGATSEEIAEAIRVATEIHDGGTFAHPAPDAGSHLSSLRKRLPEGTEVR